MKTERELFLDWHYSQYLLENPDIEIANAKYIYDYAHKNPLVYQMRDTCFIAWQARVPEGYVVVPKEPTYEMIDAAIGNNGHIESIYRDMIEAAEK